MIGLEILNYTTVILSSKDTSYSNSKLSMATFEFCRFFLVLSLHDFESVENYYKFNQFSKDFHSMKQDTNFYQIILFTKLIIGGRYVQIFGTLIFFVLLA